MKIYTNPNKRRMRYFADESAFATFIINEGLILETKHRKTTIFYFSDETWRPHIYNEISEGILKNATENRSLFSRKYELDSSNKDLINQLEALYKTDYASDIRKTEDMI